jgi:exportin-7
MVELGEDEERFERFMLPLAASFENLGNLLSQADTPMFRAEEAKVFMMVYCL